MKNIENLLTKHDSFFKEHNMIPNVQFANGFLLLLTVEVVTFDIFKEWLSIRQKEFFRGKNRENLSDDMKHWYYPQCDLYDRFIKLTENINAQDIDSVLTFEQQLRTEYANKLNEFIEAECYKDTIVKDYQLTAKQEVVLAEKNAYTEIVTNFSRAILLDPDLNNTEAAKITLYFQEKTNFPKR